MFLLRVRCSALRQLLVLVLFFPRLVVNPSSLSRPRFRREVFAPRLRAVAQQVSHERILLFLDFVGIISFRLRRRRRKVVLLLHKYLSKQFMRRWFYGTKRTIECRRVVVRVNVALKVALLLLRGKNSRNPLLLRV